MGKFLFTNILGSFVFNDKCKVVDSILFKSINDYQKKEEYGKKLIKKNKDVKEAEEKDIKKILKFFKNNKYYSEFYKNNYVLTIKGIKNSVTDDVLLCQAVNTISDVEKNINILVKRLRDWYSFYNPELADSIESHEKFVELVQTKDKKEILKYLKVKKSIGKDLSKQQLKPILELAKQVKDLFLFKQKMERNVEKIMKTLCPNLTEVAGFLLGAKLIEEAGSLQHLATMPASTIQLLGAEKALFRHIRNKRNLPPKFGVIYAHPLVQKNMDHAGKVSRALSDKISIAVRVDYFKGKFIGDKLRKELEERFE